MKNDSGQFPRMQTPENNALLFCITPRCGAKENPMLKKRRGMSILVCCPSLLKFLYGDDLVASDRFAVADREDARMVYIDGSLVEKRWFVALD